MTVETSATNAWRDRLEQAFLESEPYIGHPLKPLPIRKNPQRTEKLVTYVELDLVRFVEQYAARTGNESVSGALRRLAIIGAIAEGYIIDGDSP